MQTFQQLLDALAERAGSDRKAAIALGIAQQSFSIWRRGIAVPNDHQAVKIAAALALPLEYVLAAIAAERTHDRTARAAWLRIAASFKSAAMYAVMTIGAASFGLPLLKAAQCVVRSHPRRRLPRSRSSTKTVTVKSLPAPAATTLPRRDWLGGLR